MALPNCGTDYSTPCGTMPRSIWQMLADCMVNYPGCNIAGTPVTFLNVISVTGYCDDLTSFWSCAIQGVDDAQAQRALVENLFAMDDCGNLAIKLFLNQGTEQ